MGSPSIPDSRKSAHDPGRTGELKTAVGALDQVASVRHRAGAADPTPVREARSAERASENGSGVLEGGNRPERISRRRGGRAAHLRFTGNAVRTQWTAAPAPSANGVMNAAIARAVLQPRSLTIMKKFAMHGMKRVIVTMETTICSAESFPWRASSKRTDEQKSRRRNPTTKDPAVSRGSPRNPVRT